MGWADRAGEWLREVIPGAQALKDYDQSHGAWGQWLAQKTFEGNLYDSVMEDPPTGTVPTHMALVKAYLAAEKARKAAEPSPVQVLAKIEEFNETQRKAWLQLLIEPMLMVTLLSACKAPNYLDWLFFCEDTEKGLLKDMPSVFKLTKKDFPAWWELNETIFKRIKGTGCAKTGVSATGSVQDPPPNYADTYPVPDWTSTPAPVYTAPPTPQGETKSHFGLWVLAAVGIAGIAVLKSKTALGKKLRRAFGMKA